MEKNDLTNIIFFTNGTASHCWRVDGMARWINEETPDAVYVTDWKKWNKRLPQGTSTVIIELLTSPDMVNICHKAGAKVIYEADDAFIDSYGKERKNLDHISDSHKEKTLETIRSCDAMIVTSDVLKENYARFTDKPIYVFPNYMDFGWYGEGKINVERNSDEVRIGWFGSKGHLEDLQMVTPAIHSVLKKYKNAKFIYCGFGGMSSGRLATEAGWGEDIFSSIPRDRREYVVGVREDTWPMKHRFLDLDIGIAPLVDDYFNSCKTPIKWMEYAALRTPAVCSPTLYADIVSHGEDGFIAKTQKEWEEYLSKLIEDKELRVEMGKKAHTKVKSEYDLVNHRDRWISIVKEVNAKI